MLKSAIHVLISVALLFGTAGVTITRHYCGTDLIDTELYSTPDNCCGDDCPLCHNEKISFRIADQFESTRYYTEFKTGCQTLLEKYSFPLFLTFSNSTRVSLVDEGPGGPRNKLFSSKPFYAGQSPPILQVFLF